MPHSNCQQNVDEERKLQPKVHCHHRQLRFKIVIDEALVFVVMVACK
jgi:hypothetical protein